MARTTKPETTAVVPIPSVATNTSIFTKPLIDPFDLPDGEAIDWADDGSSDIEAKWPEIKLVQGTTRGIADSDDHIGDYYHSDSGDFEEELHVIPLHKQDQRAFFGDDANAPLCSSRDGYEPQPHQALWMQDKVKLRSGNTVPVPRLQGQPQPKTCGECPFSQFVDGDAPLCGQTILLMLKREDGSFAQMRIGATALSPFRTAVGKLVRRGRRLPMFTHWFIFGSSKMEKGSKKWQQLSVTTNPLAPAEMLEMNALVKAMTVELRTVAEEARMDDETIIHDVTPRYDDSVDPDDVPYDD